MKGSAFAKTLPRTHGAKREQMILDAVRRRDIAPIAWEQIQTMTERPDGRKYLATIKVSKDALRVGDATDSFRVSVNHRTAQHIADELGVVLPTPKLSDEIWAQAAVKPKSSSQARDWYKYGTMSTTEHMLEQSQHVDALIAKEQQKTGRVGLIADVGKDWVTDKSLWDPYTPSANCEKGHPRAANYGWHAKSGTYRAASRPGTYVFQPVARCHTIGHVDYSQVVRLVRRDVHVCGPGLGDTGCMVIDIRSMAAGHTLSPLISHTGVLPAMRHPDVAPSCEKDCPDDAGNQATNGMGQPISCPLDCEKLPPTEIDPTHGAPSVPTPLLVASMSTGSKLIVFGAAAALGYFALQFVTSPSR